MAAAFGAEAEAFREKTAYEEAADEAADEAAFRAAYGKAYGAAAHEAVAAAAAAATAAATYGISPEAYKEAVAAEAVAAADAAAYGIPPEFVKAYEKILEEIPRDVKVLLFRTDLFNGLETDIKKLFIEEEMKEEMKEEEMKEEMKEEEMKEEETKKLRREARTYGTKISGTQTKRLQSKPGKSLKQSKLRNSLKQSKPRISHIGRGQKAGAFVDVIKWIWTNGGKKSNKSCHKYTRVINIIILCGVSSVLLTMGGLTYAMYPYISIFGHKPDAILGYVGQIFNISFEVLIGLKDAFVTILYSLISALSTTISGSYNIILVLLQFLKNTGLWALGAVQHVIFGARLHAYLTGTAGDYLANFEAIRTYVGHNFNNVINKLQTLRMTPRRRERLSQLRASSYEYLMAPMNFLAMTYYAMFNVVCDYVVESEKLNMKQRDEHIAAVLSDLVQLNVAANQMDLPTLGYMGKIPPPGVPVGPVPPPGVVPVGDNPPKGTELSAGGKRKSKSKKSKKSKKKKSKSKKDKVKSKKRK